MKTIWLCITLYLGFGLATGCVHREPKAEPALLMSYPEEKIEIQAFWLTTPEVEPEQKLKLRVRDSETGKLIPAPAPLSVSVWTKTHSYGLVEPTVKATDEVGVYEVSGIYFLAKGQWEVRVYMDRGLEKNPMQKFLVDLGQEALNPIDDPNSAMYRMMKKTGMDHKNMNHGAHEESAKDEAVEAKAKAKTQDAAQK